MAPPITLSCNFEIFTEYLINNQRQGSKYGHGFADIN